MAQKIIDLGTSPNKGDGDPLRTAFTKINDNFTELYTGSPIVPQDLRGSVFGDDSTLLVDGVNSKIVGPIESTSILPGDGTTDIGSTSNRFYNAWFTGQVETDSVLANIFYGPLTGNVTGDVSGTAGAVAFSGITGKPTTLAGYGITDAMVSGAAHDGDITGSVFGDDSTLLVDGINNKIVGAVETASLRTSENKIALGFTAGESNQGLQGIGIGSGAGRLNQTDNGIAIGSTAGYTNQGSGAIGIGVGAGYIDQGDRAIAIGQNAGLTTQSNSAVAIGDNAGETTQGAESVAIGKGAGKTNQAANSIVINATGLSLNNIVEDTFLVKPVRGVAGATLPAGFKQVAYNPTTGEFIYYDA